jgi:hypothetical protein
MKVNTTSQFSKEELFMRSFFFLSLLSLLMPFSTLAQTGSLNVIPPEPKCPACTLVEKHKCSPTERSKDCPREWGNSEEYRDDSNHTFMVGYQYATTWVIGKTQGSYTYVAGRKWSFELEYVTSERTVEIGDFEIGKIKEDRITLFSKYYLNNSFHFSFGPYFYDYEIETAGSLRNLINQDLNQKWNLTGFGAAFAFGSRWQTKWGLTYGLDWVRMNYPLYTSWLNKNTGEVEETSRKDADRSFELLRKIPTFAFFTVGIGYTF